MRRVRITSCSLLFFLIITTQSALADGKYFRLGVGDEADPDMPFQRAVIQYKDGIQTMIVESAVEGTGSALGWVLPLPAEPTEITACTPGTLTSTYQLIGPRVDAHGRGRLTWPLFFFVTSLVVCLVVAFDRYTRAQNNGRMITNVVALIIFGTVVLSILTASLGTAGLSTGGGLIVTQQAQVGSYDVAVLRGSSAGPVQKWLGDNGFVIDATSLTTLERYATDGWCFVVARINTTSTATLSPHPLQLVFPAARAIYPMALTGVGLDALQLDLYVIADYTATSPHLDTVSSDTYHRGIDRTNPFFDTHIEERFEVHVGRRFSATTARLNIGHPAVTRLMWPGCTLTHLRGQLKTEQMAEDLLIGGRLTQRGHRTYYTASAARALATSIALSLASLILLPLGLITMARSPAPRGAGWLIKTSLPVIIVCALVGVIAFGVLPQTHAAADSREMLRRMIKRRDFQYHYANVLKDAAQNATPQELLAFDKWWTTHLESESWTGSIKDDFEVGDVPGGYTLTRTTLGWEVVSYDEYATPTSVTIPVTAAQAPLPQDPH